MKAIGRPKSLPEEKKGNYIQVRSSQEEKETIVRLAKENGQTITKYILEAALKRPQPKVTLEVLNQLKNIGTEMNRAGNNINQLAKSINSYNKIGISDPAAASKFNALIDDYVGKKQLLIKILKKLAK